MKTFIATGVVFYFVYNLAETLCCVGRLKHGVLQLENWTLYLSCSGETMSLNPTAKREWVETINEPSMTDEYFEFYYGMKRAA